MLVYSKEIIDKVSSWIEDGDIRARHWLSTNGYNELVELREASLNNTKAIEYLLIHKHYVLVAFVNAIWEDKKAMGILMEKKEFLWAAMASYINGDDKAAVFLEKNNLKHYASLAAKIQKQIQKDGDKKTNFFRKPFNN